MSLTARTCLSTMIWLALCGQSMSQETDTKQDQKTAPSRLNSTCKKAEFGCLSDQQKTKNINDAPIAIVSDYAESQGDKTSHFRGNVIIKQGHRTVKAETATLTQPENVIIAKENIFFHDGHVAIDGEDLEYHLDTEKSTLSRAKYKMMCTPGRGEAKKVFKNGTTFYQLEDGTYTTCPDEDDSWRFKAGRLEKKEGDLFADLYHARFEVLDTPILYLPYLRVPVEDGRLTGFLFPSFGWNDTDGFELETPFYWNIAPQLDMLITPKYMTNRGLFTSFEPRYLTQYGEGGLIYEYMGSDKAYDVEKSWGINWRHSGIKNHWKFNADYSQVSDISYFTRHTDSRIGNREDNTLLQTMGVSYRNTNWDTSLNVRNFQALSANASVYKLLPQLSFNYYRPDIYKNIGFNLPTQISQFTTNNKLKPDSLRIDLQPNFILPYSTPWLSATAEGKLFYTYYEQSNIDFVTGLNGEKLEKQVSRLVPMTRLHTKIILERNSDFLGNAYTQTLEPQLQYLYIKDVNQTHIYNPVNYAGGGYDTARLQTDYYGLFRANQFSSIDYINPANQFTFGASSRFFDDQYKERFNIAFGQIYYLDRNSLNQDKNFDYSAWAMESELNLFDQFSVRGSVEYDSNLSNLQFGNLTAEYRKGSFFAQTSYRYVSKDYISSTIGINNLDLITEDGISQLGLVTGFPITNKLRLSGQYFHDMTQDLMLENQIGLAYTSACWVIGLSFNQYLLARSNINQPAKYENNFSLSFSLLGLGANAGFGYSTANGNTLGYRNPFGLKN